MNNADNIGLFNADKNQNLSEEKLLAYLEGKLSAAEKHNVELIIAENGLEADALEGLQGLSFVEAKQTVRSINHSLRKKILQKRKTKFSIENYWSWYWSWLAIAIILLLAIAAFLIIKMSLNA